MSEQTKKFPQQSNGRSSTPSSTSRNDAVQNEIRDFRDLFKNIFDLHDEIGVCLRRRLEAGLSLDPNTFPETEAEIEVWNRFTAPENFESMKTLYSLTTHGNSSSDLLWKKALAESEAKAKMLAHAH
jgi:hypothetical protein